MTVRSNLSYEDYKAWCASRFPPLTDGGVPPSLMPTIPANTSDSCPVTVRSVDSRAVITPRSKGSR